MAKLKEYTLVKPIYDMLVGVVEESKKSKEKIPAKYLKQIKEQVRYCEEYEIVGN